VLSTGYQQKSYTSLHKHLFQNTIQGDYPYLDHIDLENPDISYYTEIEIQFLKK